jgi:CHASE2 domain-containing sensor protein
MSASRTGFTVIGETDVPDPPAPAAPPDHTAWTKANAEMLLLALKALSQRTLTAITNAMTLLLVGSAWMLWWRVLPEPSVPQLVGLGGYAVFVLLIDVVRRRTK